MPISKLLSSPISSPVSLFHFATPSALSSSVSLFHFATPSALSFSPPSRFASTHSFSSPPRRLATIRCSTADDSEGLDDELLFGFYKNPSDPLYLPEELYKLPPDQIFIPSGLKEILSQSFDSSRYNAAERLTNFLAFAELARPQAFSGMGMKRMWRSVWVEPFLKNPVWVVAGIDESGAVVLHGFTGSKPLLAALMLLKKGLSGRHTVEEIRRTYRGFFLMLDLPELGDTFFCEAYLLMSFITEDLMTTLDG